MIIVYLSSITVDEHTGVYNIKIADLSIKNFLKINEDE